MGVSPGVGVWINENNQQPPKAESKSSESVNSKSKSKPKPKPKRKPKSKSVSFINADEERKEAKKQLTLWRAQEKEYPWHDYPPKVKVTQTEKGETHLNMQFTIGLPPEAVFDIISSHDNQTYSYHAILKRPKILQHVKKEVINDNGRQEKLMEVEYYTPWKFLWRSGTIPVFLSFNENRKDFTILYLTSREKVMYMKTFAGKLRIEPWYIDNDKFCKPRLPKSREEYKKCSGGQGLVGSKLILDQVFKPLFLLNLPPVSWYIRQVIIKNTKILMEDLQVRGAVIRSVQNPSSKSSTTHSDDKIKRKH